ncbi:MAG: TIGR00725 family protein [Alphaproteobacteria bacterium]|nr:TIGR00725 family protein [Alphaproteobacteria bacterium]
MQQNHTRRPIAAVVGATSPSQELIPQAEALGTGLVDAGFRIATGGLGGVMEAASRGARGALRWTEGSIIGVLPGLVSTDANPYVDIVIPTGMNYARNTILVAMADVVVAVGGGSGTLSELALAWQHGKPIVALDLGEGWSSRLAGERLDQRRDDLLHPARSAGEAVQLAQRLVGSREGSRGF